MYVLVSLWKLVPVRVDFEMMTKLQIETFIFRVNGHGSSVGFF